MSAKKRIECFKSALPGFLKDQETYKANREQGVRPAKTKIK